MTSPADYGWGDPRRLTYADMTDAQLWPGHVVHVRDDDVAVAMVALVRRLRAAGWPGPTPLLDEWGFNHRLKRWAEDKYRTQGLTETQWLAQAPLSEWSDHAWGTAVDLDAAANPMLATRPADVQAHTTMPVAACPGIAADLGLEWGGSWDAPWDPQHWQVAVTPQRLTAIADQIRRDHMTWADVSHYNTLDLAAYTAAYDRIGLKVTEGTGYTDPTFAARYAYARAHGIPAVLYHFDRAAFNGAAQFDHFLAAIQSAGGPRPFPLDLMCLDSEDTDTPTAAAASADAFTSRAVQAGYPQGSVYTGVWFAAPHGITPSVLHPGWRRLWLSDYDTSHTDTAMPLPPGWTRTQVIARQYSSTATMTGIGGPCDASRVLNEWLANPTQTQAGAFTVPLDADVQAYLDAKFQAGLDKTSDTGRAIVQGDPAHPNSLTRLRQEIVAGFPATDTAPARPGLLPALADRLSDLEAAVEKQPTGGGVDPAAVAAAIDLQALAALVAAQLATHIQLKAV